ncbi:MAG: hypothetical protein AB7G17_08750 [Phycisphaerales bacterium]
MAYHVTTVPAKTSADDEKKNKTGLKDSLNGGALGQTNVRIVSITWEDQKNHWIVAYES